MLKPLSSLADTSKDEDIPLPPDEGAPAADAEAAKDDPMAELAAAVVEQPPPSINDAAAAPSAEQPAEKPAAEAEAKPEPLDKEMDELLAAIAEREGVSIEEARKIVERDGMAAATRKAALVPPPAGDAREEALARQAGYSGGGGQATAPGMLFSAIGKGFSLLGPEGQHARKLRSRQRQREKWLSQWSFGFDEEIEKFYDSGDKFKKAVDDFNRAFMSTEAASRLEKIAEDNGQTLGEFMKDLNEGRTNSPEALAAANEAASAPAAKAAYGNIETAKAASEAALREADRFARKLERNFPDSIDPEKTAAKLQAASDHFLKGMGKPLFEPGDQASGDKKAKKERKKFEESIREITEAIQKMIQRLLAKVGLGGPKA